MDFVVIIITLGIVQGLFLGFVFLFIKRENRRANTFLGLLYILFSVSIVHFILHRTNAYYLYPHLIRLSFPPLFLFGPLFYYYSIILIDRQYKFTWKDSLHLIPFLLIVVSSIPFFLLPGEEKIKYLNDLNEGKEKVMPAIVGVLQIAHVFIYIVVMRIKLKRYRQKLEELRASTEKICLNWLYNAIVFLLIIFGLMFVLMILWVLEMAVMEVYMVSIPVLVTFVIFYSGYLALVQPDIVFTTEEKDSFEEKKYEKSSLTKEKSKDIRERLVQSIKEEKPHLDPDISLGKLSGKLGISPNHLSQVINESMGLTFFDLINRERVEEAKKMLKENPAYTILAVAIDCGFNSKSAFNSAFKKFAGMTPTAYKNS